MFLCFPQTSHLFTDTVVSLITNFKKKNFIRGEIVGNYILDVTDSPIFG